MTSPKQYFDLPLDSLRAIAGWAAECAGRALPIYEAWDPSDSRPRAAIDGACEFANGGKRTAKIRLLAMDAYRASLEADVPAASAAARAASLAAASAYTHPFVDVNQAKHILGPAAYAALAIEVSSTCDQNVGDAEVRLVVAITPQVIRDVLKMMPTQQVGKNRIEKIMHMLDSALRCGL